MTRDEAPEPCRLGYVEHDGYQYCFEHSGWHHYTDRSLQCSRARYEPTLPIHRTEAGWPRCSTCDGGGCPDCTDPA